MSRAATERRAPGVARRIRVAEALAFAGLVAALIAAVGPAERVQTTYAWPPRAVSGGAPQTLWYTPLLLSARIPESLMVSFPCDGGQPLTGASDVYAVLATARSHRRVGGLAVVRDGDRIITSVGESTLAGVPVRDAAGCSYQLVVAAGRWSLTGGADGTRAGSLAYMPVVNGFFSEIEFRSSPELSVDVTTRVHATRATTLQSLGRLVAALAVLLALALVSFGGMRRLRTIGVGDRMRRLRGRARSVDAVVGFALVGWWILAPAMYDDGWVVARQGGFSTVRGFSNYYDALGTNLPNGYWLEWVQHWLTQSSNSVIVLRLPALTSLFAIWVICRWVLGRITTSPDSPSRVVLWTLAAGFLAGAFAWGMTLRPEPFTALLVAAVLACAVCFVERESVGALALTAVLVPLAVTGHHAGVTAAAPLLAVSPWILRWARSNFPAAVAIATTAFASILLLAFLGSDLGQRSQDARSMQLYGVEHAWYDEFLRYARLSEAQSGASLRRAFVALTILAVLSFVFRRTRTRQLLDVPTIALAISLVLLFLTPSKWVWHFGTLIALTCTALAAEVIRLRRDAKETHGWNAQPILGVLAVAGAIAWAWADREVWGALDLQTLDWRPAFEQTLSLTMTATVVPILALVVLAIRDRRGNESATRAPWRVVALAVPILVLPLIVFTAGSLLVDTVKTSSWTLLRQNVQTLRNGGSDCGLANAIAVPQWASFHSLDVVRGEQTRTERRQYSDPSLGGLPLFNLGPVGAGIAVSSWFELPRSNQIGLFFSGTLGASDSLSVEYRNGLTGDAASVRDEEIAVYRGVRVPGVTWKFVALDTGASTNAVRIRLKSDSTPGAAISITAPMTYERQSLAETLGAARSRTLTNAGLRTYFPCVEQPVLRNGVAEVPDYVVGTTSLPIPVGYTTSPFFGLHDVYPSTQLEFAATDAVMAYVAIYRVEPRIPGGRRISLTDGSDSMELGAKDVGARAGDS